MCVADALCGTAEAITTSQSNYPQKTILLRGYYLRTRSYSKQKRKEKEFSPQAAPCPSLQAVWIHLSWFWLRVCRLGWPWSLSPRKENVSGWAWICVDTVGGVSSGSEPQLPHHSHGGNCYFTGQLREFNFTTHMPSFCKTEDQSKLLFSSVLLS